MLQLEMLKQTKENICLLEVGVWTILQYHSHRVGHDWNDLAAALAAAYLSNLWKQKLVVVFPLSPP